MVEKTSKITVRVEDEHEALNRDLKNIKAEMNCEVTEEEFHGWKRNFVRLLRNYRNVLLNHHGSEEDGGFMSELVSSAPRISGKVEKLQAEHGQFIRRLDDIIGDLKVMDNIEQARMNNICERLKQLVKDLFAHEDAEKELINKVYYEDIGEST